MKPVRVRTALIAGALAAVVLGIVFQLVVNAGSALPRHSWWEAALVLVAGAALASGGWRIRRYVESLTSRPSGGTVDPDAAPPSQPRTAAPGVDLPSPENARRTLVLAQAAAVGGAVLAGWYLAQAGVQLPRWNVGAVRSAILLLVVLAVEAVGLSALGFTVQKWCTLPEERR